MLVASIKKNQVFAPQRPIVFPANGQTDITKFDISLHVKLLLELNVCKTNAFKKSPNLLPLDTSKQNLPVGTATVGDFLQHLKDMRNFLLHHSPTSIQQHDFERYWKLMEDILKGLKYDVTNIADLKGGYIPYDSHFIHAITLSKIEYQGKCLEEIKAGLLKLTTADMPKTLGSIQNKLDEGHKIATKTKDEILNKVASVAEDVKTISKDVKSISANVDSISADVKTVAAIAKDVKKSTTQVADKIDDTATKLDVLSQEVIAGNEIIVEMKDEIAGK